MSDINKQLEDWNWSKGGSIGIVKSSKDLESLKELIAQVQQEAVEVAKRKAVLDYILSLGWQDTENEYVKEVLDDAEIIANELQALKGQDD